MRKKIEKAAIEDLGKECKGKKRPTWSTQHLRREYLYIFIQNSPESYVKPDRNHWISRKIEVINTDLNCRKCQINDGTLNHVINCGKNTYITVDALDDMENENVINLKLVAKRIYDFIEEVG